MAVTALAVSVDNTEYSRLESDHNTITVSVSPTGTSLAGEQITVTLFKARRNRDVSVSYKTLTLTGGSVDTTTFVLPEILDAQDQFPKVRRGSYFVKVASVSSPSVAAITPDFLVSIITVDKFKKDYLFGAHLKAFEVLSVHSQPQVITGVTVSGVSQGHPQMLSSLAYTYTDPGGGNPIIRLLSWCGGPAVAIKAGTTKYTLFHGDSVNYIDVTAILTSLPTVTLSEKLLIERQTLGDDKIRSHIEDAISWLEDAELKIFIEPTLVASESDPTVTYATGSDIANFVAYDVDRITMPVNFHRPSGTNWLNLKLPYYPVIRFNKLYGKVSNVPVLNVPLEFIETKEVNGHTAIVPFNSSVSFSYLGFLYIQSLYNANGYIPNMWNYIAYLGFRITPPVLVELIAKKAAVDLLTIAGMAYRPFASTSISHDGASESVSYIVGQQFGQYSGPINAYKTWINENLQAVKGSFAGIRMSVA